jgi:hypothetical protein
MMFPLPIGTSNTTTVGQPPPLVGALIPPLTCRLPLLAALLRTKLLLIIGRPSEAGSVMPSGSQSLLL